MRVNTDILRLMAPCRILIFKFSVSFSLKQYFFTLQKWSKGKVRDKLNNAVLFDKANYEKLYKEVPQYKLITPAVVSERLKVRGSLARRALVELREKGTFYFPKLLRLAGRDCSWQ